VGQHTPQEGLVYNYWLTVLMLLKLGIPYTDILNFTEDEISLIIGLSGAISQREMDAHERQQRIAQAKRQGG
tara:strand:+ start:608 stop:823 length:216 start_codon:yes stop_codon:yes gene_type:complete